MSHHEVFIVIVHPEMNHFWMSHQLSTVSSQRKTSEIKN